MTDIHFNIAEDFSPYTGGRHSKDGSHSGEALRSKIVELLNQSRKSGGRVIISLDGAIGYGASFLEEAFGGLVREAGFSKKELSGSLEIRCDSPVYSPYRDLAMQSIAEAKETAVA